MAAVLEVKERVARYLAELAPVTVDADGDFSIRQGSARVFVSVGEFGDDHTWVQIACPLLRGVNVTQDLLTYIAYEGGGFRYGTFLLLGEKGSSTSDLLITHGLLGDYLDPDELKLAVALLALTADDLDDALQQRFGGQRFHED